MRYATLRKRRDCSGIHFHQAGKLRRCILVQTNHRHMGSKCTNLASSRSSTTEVKQNPQCNSWPQEQTRCLTQRLTTFPSVTGRIAMKPRRVGDRHVRPQKETACSISEMQRQQTPGDCWRSTPRMSAIQQHPLKPPSLRWKSLQVESRSTPLSGAGLSLRSMARLPAMLTADNIVSGQPIAGQLRRLLTFIQAFKVAGLPRLCTLSCSLALQSAATAMHLR
jgi:hypothetical protein